MKRRRVALLACAVAAISVVGATAALAGDNDAGFKTSQAAMLSCPSCGSDVVADHHRRRDVPGGYRFESIPDGISLQARGNGRVDLFVNHETSTVAFPYTAAAPTATNSQNDFQNSQVSLLRSTSTARASSPVVTRSDSSENYQRFCSNYLATAKEGFDRDIFFTNEEGQDWVYRSGDGMASRSPRARPGPSRSASSSPTTRRPASIRRSTGWAGTTTRTTWRSPASATRSCSPATTRSQRRR